ncbi:MAG: DUF4115 domain-containing protein [Pseudomonadota bacterium]|nr:DUF4115 domain-containing protein [Pseudomonadota bacterium]
MPEVGQLDLAIGPDIQRCESGDRDSLESAGLAAAKESDEVVIVPLVVSFAAEAVGDALAATQSTAPSESVDAVDAHTPSELAREEVKQSLGERFRVIRESRGISREEMSRRLRVSPSVIQDIESDQWARLGAPVYVRGHLNSYAKTLNVPAVVVSLALRDLDEPTPLSLTVAASAPVTLWSRYSSAATYVVLTLLLAIPTFTMLNQRGINSPVPLVRSMADSEAGPSVNVPQQSLTQPVTSAEFVGPAQPAELAYGPALQALQQPDPMPLMASMTPMGSISQAPESVPGVHRIEMLFSQDSWLEMVDGAGARLDYGIARAGEKREHLVHGTVAMSIGNVSGVELKVDGKPVDLLQFSRLNVARLKLFETDSQLAEPTSATPSR